MKNLRTLNLSNTLITNIEHLKKLKNLSVLNLSNTLITNIEPLKELKNLQRLFLNAVGVDDFEPLKNLSKLIHLELVNTPVINNRIYNLTDIETLKTLTNLRELHIGVMLDYGRIYNELKKALKNCKIKRKLGTTSF